MGCYGVANPTKVFFFRTAFLKRLAVARLLGVFHYIVFRLRHVCHLRNTCLLVRHQNIRTVHTGAFTRIPFSVQIDFTMSIQFRTCAAAKDRS